MYWNLAGNRERGFALPLRADKGHNARWTPLPEMCPGQFAELRVDGSATTFLRRPISINFVDTEKNEVWFLIQLVGDGTRRLATLRCGDTLNVVLPLGNGFSLPQTEEKVLLIGGGVGTAPMLYLGA